MPYKRWICAICDKPYEQEAGAVECEQSHAKEKPCKHVKANGKKDDCISTVLINGDVTTVTYTWTGGSKSQTYRFEYDSSNVPEIYTDGGEIDANGHIGSRCTGEPGDV